MKHISDINISEWMEIAQSNVGNTFDLGFQTLSKYGEVAGQFEILSFQPDEDPKFKYTYWKHEEQQTPDGLELGVYEIKLLNTKQNNGKIFHFKVSAFFSELGGHYNESIYISTKRLEDNKYLKAYEFGFLNER